MPFMLTNHSISSNCATFIPLHYSTLPISRDSQLLTFHHIVQYTLGTPSTFGYIVDWFVTVHSHPCVSIRPWGKMIFEIIACDWCRALLHSGWSSKIQNLCYQSKPFHGTFKGGCATPILKVHATSSQLVQPLFQRSCAQPPFQKLKW